tara:strand:- start:118 stop:222 length:105 start_codon:yes stop_codon:yes gene_type:complete
MGKDMDHGQLGIRMDRKDLNCSTKMGNSFTKTFG